MNLESGEVICIECNGTGGIILGSFNNPDLIYCNKCNGTGKLDWIENIVGKKSDADLIVEALSHSLKCSFDKEFVIKVMGEQNEYRIRTRGNSL